MNDINNCLMNVNPLIKIQVARQGFLNLKELIVVGDFNTTRLNDTEKVKSISQAHPNCRVTYFPNGVFGDVIKITKQHKDLLELLFILDSNDVKYTIYHNGEFEADTQPRTNDIQI